MDTILDDWVATGGVGMGSGEGGAESRTARRAVEEPVMRGSGSAPGDVCDRPDGDDVEAAGMI